MPSTALTTAKLSWRDKMRYALTGTPVVVEHQGDVPDEYPDAQVKRREISIYRPPTALSLEGHAQAGISKELFAHYLVAVVEQQTGAEIPSADVTFGEAVGRFATVDMTMPQWGSTLTFMIPIGMITKEIKDALDVYMAGLALKVGQTHRGHQNHTNANQLFDTALRRFQALRDDQIPHFQMDAEYLFLVAQCQRAKKINPLKTIPGTEQILDRTPKTEQASA